MIRSPMKNESCCLGNRLRMIPVQILRLFFVCLPFLFVVNVHAEDSITSYKLDEVMVETSLASFGNDHYTSGVTMLLPKESLENRSSSSLADLTTSYTPFFLKETGNGMLSTMAMRGTSASHTKVCWNGLPVNSLTMGQTDFSLLPVFFFDDVAFHPGGECSVHGNGAIGGAVSLTDDVRFDDSSELDVKSSVASYGTIFEGAKFSVANKRIASKTSAFFRRSENDFSFTYSNEEHRQKNAQFYDYGVMQNLGYSLSERQRLFFRFWHTFYDREIQPMKQMNDDENRYESISNQSTRVLADYENFLLVVLKVRIGWMKDKQLYESHKIATDDWLGQFSAERDWFENRRIEFRTKAGTDVHYIVPDVYAYLKDAEETRTSVYFLSKVGFASRVWLSANFRKEFITELSSPCTPSVSVSCLAVSSDKQKVTVNTGASRNANAPSLNSRYWGSIDNHDLKSECAVNVEMNGLYEFNLNGYSLSVQPSMYRNDVKDWILWMPRGNIWKPINIDRVLAKGFELNINQCYMERNTSHAVNFSYSYNHTEVKKGFSQMKPFVGRQIALLPEHTLSAYLLGKVGNTSYQITCRYVGERTTSDVFEKMDAYWLLNVSAEYAWRFKNEKNVNVLTVGASANNLLGTVYEVMPFRAMPKQNFSIFARYTARKQLH